MELGGRGQGGSGRAEALKAAFVRSFTVTQAQNR